MVKRLACSPHAVFCLAATLVAGAVFLAPCSSVRAAGPQAPTWNREAAARYLDSRELYWQSWDHAKREQGTFCVSCHTQIPLAYAMPALRRDLDEAEVSAPEQALLANIHKRLQMWKDLPAYYPNQPRSTEAVLNALILLRYDQRHLSADSQAALSNLWALQDTTGADAGSWGWFNFDLAPWEVSDGRYFAAAMVAEAVANAPDHYAQSADVSGNLAALRVYLVGHAAQQPLLNRIVELWAAARMQGLLTPQQRKQLIAEIYDRQNLDGGWTLASLGPTAKKWERKDGTAEPKASDGYATGLAMLALEANRSSGYYFQLGLHWLATHQDPSTGTWPAESLNKNRDPSTNVGQFMTDASTGFAALALAEQP